jgi:protein involved in polysaccharide export with SLBB domain
MRPTTRPTLLLLAATAALSSGGCASLTNPVADGVPVRRLPAEVLGRSKADLKPIPLTALKQPELDPYRLDKGDVLAVVADGLLGSDAQVPPVKLPDPTGNTAALGYPIPVNDDGTISVPRLPRLDVRGLTLAEAEQLVKDYAFGVKGGKELLKPASRVSVQLLQKRRYQVTVVREDSQVPQLAATGGAVLGGSRRGNGYSITLEAGQNDVLRALNATGGPPGLDARDEVIIYRSAKNDNSLNVPAMLDGASRKQLVMNGDAVAVRIPLRLYPEQALSFSAADITLRDGDIVYIEARDTEFYFTAGLFGIGSGQYPLPRDYDLNVVQAISQVRAPLLNGGFTQTSFVAAATGSGIGNPSPSRVSVLRQVSQTQQINIRVDLNRAFIDPRERLIIRPGDIIVMQETPGEAMARYVTQTLRFSTAFDAVRSASLNSTGVSSNP